METRDVESANPYFVALMRQRQARMHVLCGTQRYWCIAILANDYSLRCRAIRDCASCMKSLSFAWFSRLATPLGGLMPGMPSCLFTSAEAPLKRLSNAGPIGPKSHNYNVTCSLTGFTCSSLSRKLSFSKEHKAANDSD